MGGGGVLQVRAGGPPHPPPSPPHQRLCVVKSQVRGGGRLIYQTLRWRGRGGPPPSPRAHLQISDVSDQVIPDFSIAQETILVNRNSRKLQGAFVITPANLTPVCTL